MRNGKPLSIPKRLAVVAIAIGGLAGCPPSNPEPPCSYICNSDAALAIGTEDGGPDPYQNGYTDDMGDECHRTFC